MPDPMTAASTSRRIMLITGGSRGIGAATAVLAAQRGYDVALNYRNDRAAADLVASAVREAGGRAVILQADVSDESQVVSMFAELDARLGRLDVLVNNAGILERQARVEALEAARLSRILATNVIGSFVCAREAVRRMSTRHGGKGGAIVNVSSVAARLGSPGEYVDYAASKGAVDTMTIGLAAEVAGEGVRVNAVRPGFIYTDMHASGGEPGRVDRVKHAVPLQRGGTAEEVAAAILWLASDESGYSTGAFIDIAGGK